MKDIKRFVEQLFKHQHLDKQDPDAVSKLIEMLEEKVDDLKEEGIEEEEAIHKTIIEFGEADDFIQPLIIKEKRRYKRQKTIRHYKNDVLFASISSALIIAVIIVINFQYLPFSIYGPWFIIPTAGILFWPLSLIYKLLNKKGE